MCLCASCQSIDITVHEPHTIISYLIFIIMCLDSCLHDQIQYKPTTTAIQEPTTTTTNCSSRNHIIVLLFLSSLWYKARGIFDTEQNGFAIVILEMWAYFKFIIDVDGGRAATADDLNHFSKAKCYTLTRFFASCSYMNVFRLNYLNFSIIENETEFCNGFIFALSIHFLLLESNFLFFDF